jgi:hemerythrin-like metal-binding protein
MPVSAAEGTGEQGQPGSHTVTEVGRAQLIEWNPGAFTLGVSDMDAAHQTFVALLNRLNTAPNPEFPELFRTLLEHTREHFEREETRMRLSRFPALTEHCSEHRRVLGELAQLQKQVDKGRLSFARNYVKDGLSVWFRLHLATMDSALAAHWKRHQASCGR